VKDIVEQLTKKYQKTIEYLARRYCIKNHYMLEYDDLVSEGFVVFTEILNAASNADFDKVFYRSLCNRYISLLRKAFNKSRNGYTVDLTEAYSLAGADFLNEVFVDEVINHLEKMLSQDSWNVLKELLFPNEEICSKAMFQGKDVTNKIIANSLGLDSARFRICVGEIRCNLEKLGLFGSYVYIPLPQLNLRRK
jgi:hypothetical protein